MLLLITKVPYLRMCPRCGIHGQIVLGDGSASGPFVTKSMAREKLEMLVRLGYMSDEEKKAVETSIEAASMIEYGPALDEAYRFLVRAAQDPMRPVCPSQANSMA